MFWSACAQMDDNVSAVLKMLGLARRSGALAVGQDDAMSSLRGSVVYITTEDCSESVKRKIAGRIAGGRCIHCMIRGVSREELGHSVGVNSTQITALPRSSPFVIKILELLKWGARIDE